MKRFGIISASVAMLLLYGTLFAQQKDMAVTVYNSNVALVKDVRTAKLVKGEGILSFSDVAENIDPTSVSFSSLSDPEGTVILEQNFEYDLVNPAKVLLKYVDEKVKLTLENEKQVEGTLLSSGGSDVVLRTGKGEIKIYPRSTIRGWSFPKLPEGLITKPTLVWLLESARGGKQDVEVRYLTRNMSWHAEYVAEIEKEEINLRLASWVSIDNRSGASYSDAKLKVVAGDVRRVQPPVRRPYRKEPGAAIAFEARGFEERTFFEYHIYDLGRRTTLKNNQVKQISLFEPAVVGFEKKYEFVSNEDRKNVRVLIEFDNSESSGLGVPLPAGTVRIYKEDSDGSLEFAGEDRIEHTPKDERVKIRAGNVFDVKPEWRMTERVKLSSNKWRQSIELKLRNHKDEDVTIGVIETLEGSWKVKKASHRYHEVDARNIRFDIEVPAGGESIVTYTYEFER